MRYTAHPNWCATLSLSSSAVFLLLLVFSMNIRHISVLVAGALLLLVAINLFFASPAEPDLTRSETLTTVADTPSGLTEGAKPTATVATREPASFYLSSLYDLKLENLKIASPEDRPVGSGGALAVIDGSRILLADRVGQFYLLNFDNGISSITLLEQLRAPLNLDAFQEDNKKTDSRNFRVTDILLEGLDTDEIYTIYMSHHLWNKKEKCFTLSVSEAQLNMNSLNSPVDWHNRFNTTPCLPGRRVTLESGGRMATLAPDTLLVTVGIMLDKGKYWGMAANDSFSYGKIIELDKTTWESKVLTKGHRNPQGLLVDDGKIWSTEHGPRGGDELNLIIPGEDYGWPTSSYGMDYFTKLLKGSDTPGEHSLGVRPVFAWVPSVAVSNLIKLEGSGFPLWRNDFLVGSLRGGGNGNSLFRVRLHDGAVRVNERIPSGFNIRDLVEMPNGYLVLWDGKNNLQTITPTSQSFSTCTGCHTLFEGWPGGIGPNLFGVVGRPVGAIDDYEYSSAMKKLTGNWTREQLDEFLRDPQHFAPGTSMEIDGIEDANERREIIDRLQNPLQSVLDVKTPGN
jgi:cytochrome c2